MLNLAKAAWLLCALALVTVPPSAQTHSYRDFDLTIENKYGLPLGPVGLTYSFDGYGPLALNYAPPDPVRISGIPGTRFKFELAGEFGLRAASISPGSDCVGIRIVLGEKKALAYPVTASAPRTPRRGNRDRLPGTSLGGFPFDECTDPGTIVIGGTSSFDNSTGLGENPSDPVFTCSGSQGFRTAWFTVTPDVTSIFIQGTASYPILMAMYEGTCGGVLTEIACVSGTPNVTVSLVASGLTPGQTYLVQMATADPTMTGLIMVTSGVLPPENDDCFTAISIPCDSSVLAINDTATDSVTDPVYSCPIGGPRNGTGSIWYSFVASGSQATISTSAGTNAPIATDTLIGLYSGSCPASVEFGAVGGLIEIGCDDDGGDGTYSMLSINTLVTGTTYFIQASTVAFSLQGEFMLTVNCSNPPNPPPNDDQQDAAPLGVPGGVIGNNIDATSDILGPPCVVASGPFNNVWYRVQGTGETMTATTCSLLTDFDTKISVFCDEVTLPCVGGNDDDCPMPKPASTVEWCSQANSTYLITVGGSEEGAMGTFRLDIQTDGTPCTPIVLCVDPPMAPPNDAPANATTVANFPHTELVDTAGAMSDVGVPCGVQSGPFNEVWYRVQGTGGMLNVTTCSTDTQIDTRISVFCEDLANFPCVAGNENDCPTGPNTASTVQWCSQSTASYLIAVGSAAEGLVGQVRITLDAIGGTCTPTVFCIDPPMPPANDSPGNPVQLGVPASITADTTAATSDIGTACGVPSGPFNNVWYRVSGNGMQITARTCDTAPGTVDTRISVFCDDVSLPCVAGDDNSCVATGLAEVTWCSQANADYLVTIGGAQEGDVGMIRLDTSTSAGACTPTPPCIDDPPPMGDICFMIDRFRARDEHEMRLRAAFFAGEGFDPTAESLVIRVIDVIDGSLLSFTVPAGGFVLDDENEFEFRAGSLRIEIDVDDRDIEMRVDDVDIDSIDGNELTIELDFSNTGLASQTIVAIREEDDDDGDDGDDDDDDDDQSLRFDAAVPPNCFDLPATLISPPQLDVDFEDEVAGNTFSVSVIGGQPGDLVALYLVEVNGVPTAWPVAQGILNEHSEFLMESQIYNGLGLGGGEFVYAALVIGEDGEAAISDREVLRVQRTLQ